jgi:hypothetical protein
VAESSIAVQEAFRVLLHKAGATDQKLAQRLAEGLDAVETKFFQKEGRVTDSRNVINWSERRNYLELACRIKDLVPAPPKPVEPIHRQPVQLNVVYMDADGKPTSGPSFQLNPEETEEPKSED